MTKNCSQCGTQLPAGMLAGLCSACLLKTEAPAPTRKNGSLLLLLQSVIGLEYKSKATLCGLPWLHVSLGFDPNTGQRRWAKGILAIGSGASGVVAIGGVAVGGIAFGGVALGLIAAGGLAFALLASLGAIVLAPAAMGSVALGYFAFGGAVLGIHSCSSRGADPAAWDLFEPWAGPLLGQWFGGVMGLIILILLAGSGARLQARPKRRRSSRALAFWVETVAVFLAITLCLAATLFIRWSAPPARSWLISGRVIETQTGQTLPGVAVSHLAEPDAVLARAETHSQVDGRFALVLDSPMGTVAVCEPGYGTNRLPVVVQAFDRKRHARVDLRLERQPTVGPGEPVERISGGLLVPEGVRTPPPAAPGLNYR